MTVRSERVKAELKREISVILHDEIKDPRLGFITLTRVEITPDLKNANVYVSVLGDDKAKLDTIKGLKSASGYIQRLIGKRLSLKFVPRLRMGVSMDVFMRREDGEAVASPGAATGAAFTLGMMFKVDKAADRIADAIFALREGEPVEDVP